MERFANVSLPGAVCQAAFALLLSSLPVTAQPVVRVGPGGDSGLEQASGENIQKAIDRVIPTGGRIVLAPGEYRIRQTIRIRGGRGLEISGTAGVKLVLDVAPSSSLAAAATGGDRSLRLRDTTGFLPGHEIEIMDETRKAPLNGTIARIDANGVIVLLKPLAAPAPQGAPVMVTENVISILDNADGVALSNLEIDLQKDRQPFVPVNHTRHCGIFVAGLYDYAKGVRSHCRGIRIAGCKISNAHHRGIALYATTDSEIVRCRIENTAAEAIDIDHYSRRIRVADNELRTGQMSGIEINDGTDNLIERNLIEGYPFGIKCWRYPPCLMPDANQRNVVTGNTIRKSIQNAISFQRSTENNSITRNVIDGVERSHAILMMGDRSQIDANRITNAPHGGIHDGGKANVVRRGAQPDGAR